MATFTISLSGSAVVNGSKNWTLTDADVQKLSTFLIAKYGGSSSITAGQALSLWVQDFVNSTISDVRTYQQATAVVVPPAFT